MAEQRSPWQLATSLYVYPDTPAAQWCRAHPADPRVPLIQRRFVDVPEMLWLGPDASQSWIKGYVDGAVRANALAQLALYAIPNRDVGQYSAGGVPTAPAYRAWVDMVAATIGATPAIVLVETDSLIQSIGKPITFVMQRIALLQYAVTTLARVCPNTWTYLDGGDGFYSSPLTMAHLLVQAGIITAAGFAVNVSNFNSTAACTDYAAAVNAQLKKYGVPPKAALIDVSRNGAGRPADSYVAAHPDWWCNPPGVRLGQTPTLTGLVRCKQAGCSDGPTGSVPGHPSGEFVPELAVNLTGGGSDV